MRRVWKPPLNRHLCLAVSDSVHIIDRGREDGVALIGLLRRYRICIKLSRYEFNAIREEVTNTDRTTSDVRATEWIIYDVIRAELSISQWFVGFPVHVPSDG
jgi:hypothetical protein